MSLIRFRIAHILDEPVVSRGDSLPLLRSCILHKQYSIIRLSMTEFVELKMYTQVDVYQFIKQSKNEVYNVMNPRDAANGSLHA